MNSDMLKDFTNSRKVKIHIMNNCRNGTIGLDVGLVKVFIGHKHYKIEDYKEQRDNNIADKAEYFFSFFLSWFVECIFSLLHFFIIACRRML